MNLQSAIPSKGAATVVGTAVILLFRCVNRLETAYHIVDLEDPLMIRYKRSHRGRAARKRDIVSLKPVNNFFLTGWR